MLNFHVVGSWNKERPLGKEGGNSHVFPRWSVLRLESLSYLSESAEGMLFKLGNKRITLGYTISLKLPLSFQQHPLASCQFSVGKKSGGGVGGFLILDGT